MDCKFCPNCGRELTNKPMQAYLVSKAAPNCTIGDAKFVKQVVFVECQRCNFISIYGIQNSKDKSNEKKGSDF